MPRGRPPYPPEFQLRPSAWPESRGHTIRQVAQDLGIANEPLRRWMLQADIDHGDAPGLTSDERAELARLRRENRTLRLEREILKGARPSSRGRPTGTP
jgi:transposase